ncbi:Zn-ribbon domain-containing OB-fold protein [Oceanobacillus bengalensis]|uniref:Zn-ribbon domain-containing OB-fold protein n=1 Tax=Oceanobacillus bengalensis TaxID=1435466 RepID=A0A494Z2C1_9BACI|nr:Zn-ribbon domain-containing OB-fold protein [Oceanobacillus bengalensis]RKQ16633.1 Zn-ribbon domain-containing OB-fold protein [Oceanobacillus bengalensis]
MVQKIPKPIYDEESRPFWDGLNNGELLIQHCNSCRENIFYPRSICPHCFSEEIQWSKASGNGRIYSYTVVHQAFGPYKEEVPFIVGIIDLDEGVRMMTRIIGERDQIAIDKQVSVVYQQIDNDFVLPYFRLV